MAVLWEAKRVSDLKHGIRTASIPGRVAVAGCLASQSSANNERVGGVRLAFDGVSILSLADRMNRAFTGAAATSAV